MYLYLHMETRLDKCFDKSLGKNNIGCYLWMTPENLTHQRKIKVGSYHLLCKLELHEDRRPRYGRLNPKILGGENAGDPQTLG